MSPNASVPTGFGDLSALSSAWMCWWSSVSWLVLSTSYDFYYMSSYTTTVTESWYTTLSKNPDATSFYTLCDGVPRVAAPEYITSLTTSVFVYTPLYQASSLTEPPPSCTIPTEECGFLSALSESVKDQLDTNMQYQEPCSTLDQMCQVNINTAQLLYWPAATVVGDLCDSNCPNPYANATASTYRTDISDGIYDGLCPACSAKRSVIMPSDTGIVTAVYDGHTLTSPTVYYYLDSIWTNYGDVYIGTETLYNQLLPVNSADVSTIPCNADHGFNWLSQEAIDWSDLNAPPPAGAFCCTAKNATNVNTIYGEYNPWLRVPLKIRELNPAWSKCLPWVSVIDPPHALRAASAAALPVDTFKQTQPTVPIDPTGSVPHPISATVQPSAAMRPSPAPAPTATADLINDNDDDPASPEALPPQATVNGPKDPTGNPVSLSSEDPDLDGLSFEGASSNNDLSSSMNPTNNWIVDPNAQELARNNGDPTSLKSNNALPAQTVIASGWSPGDIIASVFGLRSNDATQTQGGGSGVDNGQNSPDGTGGESSDSQEGESGAHNESPESQQGASRSTQNHRYSNGDDTEAAGRIAAIMSDPYFYDTSDGDPTAASLFELAKDAGFAIGHSGQQRIGNFLGRSSPGKAAAEKVAEMIKNGASPPQSMSNPQEAWSRFVGLLEDVSNQIQPSVDNQRITEAILIAGGEVITAFETIGPSGQPEIIVGTRTLALGNTLIIGRSTFTAAASGMVHVAGTRTSLIPWQTIPAQLSEAIITIDGKRVIASEGVGARGSLEVVIDGSRFALGQVFSKDGTLISAGVSGIVEIGTVTSTVPWQTPGASKSAISTPKSIPPTQITANGGLVQTANATRERLSYLWALLSSSLAAVVLAIVL
ncbi:MAG: hypothetical protein M1820_006002 [Bogoriella megaspora]|nr:MAG: hypothetical protein M1820_006002 [Bogoriella megaspora]